MEILYLNLILADYLDYIEEKVQPWSYMKFPFLKQIGFPEGNYRVGPLAGLNIADSIPTEKASELFGEYKDKYGMAQNPLLYHYARLIELMYSVERAVELLEDDTITGTDIKTGSERTVDEYRRSKNFGQNNEGSWSN